MTRESVRFAQTVHLRHGIETNIDDLNILRAEVDTLTAKLAAANERNRTLAGDVARLAQENAALASALHKANHTADELRFQLRLANRQDARGDHD